MEIWDSIARPVIDLRETGLGGALRNAIDNAIRMLGKCRHVDLGDVTLHAVIATETILNAFREGGDIGERFALMTSSFVGKTPSERREKYHIARQLYKYRCKAVHQSMFEPEGTFNEERKQAMDIFIASLKAVVQWATERKKNNNKLNQEAFDELYLKTVIPD